LNPPAPHHRYNELIAQFAFEGEFISIEPYGFGHINETYAATFRLENGVPQRYILQCINHHVFKDPATVMANLEKVTKHLHKKIVQAGGDPRRETINLIPLRSDHSFLYSANGEYWRAEIFIEGAQTYQIPAQPEHIYHAAWAFGNFGRLLADFPVNELHDTIPDFHHTPKRYAAFISALEKDTANRAREVKAEIDFCLLREPDTHVLIDLVNAGLIPQRVTHNDTKFENVMIDDRTGRGVCVIDLDTVMPGIILFDFGDSVRSGANPAAEDEPNLSKVVFNLATFDWLAHGYLDAARDYLRPVEIDHLAFAARLLTFEQALRFLTDYLNGDIYYRTHRPGQNLDRARTQIKLVSDMEKQSEEMEQIINRYRQPLV
jgi:hypothetical protein